MLKPMWEGIKKGLRWFLVAAVLVSLFPLPQVQAQQNNDLYFRAEKTTLVRTSPTEITVTHKFKVWDDDFVDTFIKDDAFIMKLKLTTSKVKNDVHGLVDRWTIASITPNTFSYTDSDGKPASFSEPDKAYHFDVVLGDYDPDEGSEVIMYQGLIGYDLLQHDTDTPLHSVNDSSDMYVKDYYKDPDTGLNLGQGNVAEWFCAGDVQNLEISISKDKGVAPSVKVNKNDECKRPQLTFVLVAFSGVGNASHGISTVRDRQWFTFAAHLNDAKGKVIPNLFFSVSDVEDSNFIYANDFKGIKEGDTGNDEQNQHIGRASTDGAGGAKLAKSITQLTGMVNNYPIETDDCRNATTVKETGPSFERTKTDSFKVNAQESLLDAGVDDPSGFNSNCGNVAETGWVKYWGITNDNLYIEQSIFEEALGGGACGLTTLVSGGIGQIFNKLLECLIQEVFRPVMKWAADLVQQAAGISWQVDSRRYAWQYERILG